jgi:serine/threonine-protein kinase
MGSPDGYEDERAVHEVRLDAFWIDRTLVTNSQYIDCVVAGGCTSPLEDVPHHFGRPGYSDYPVVNVSWDQAQAYCAWAGRRLPTEAEWERAARGDDGRLYPWGNESPTCKHGNFKECDNGLMPVGSFELGASPYGALDMAGNVWEWVGDWYSPSYYSISPLDNPTGAVNGSIIHRAPNNGFRCAVSANT